MRQCIYFSVIAAGGAINSLHRYHHVETNKSQQQLTSNGIKNLQSGFLALTLMPLLAYGGMGLIALSQPQRTIIQTTMAWTGVNSVFAAFGSTLFGTYKMGEGAMDLYQAQPQNSTPSAAQRNAGNGA